MMPKILADFFQSILLRKESFFFRKKNINYLRHSKVPNAFNFGEETEQRRVGHDVPKSAKNKFVPVIRFHIIKSMGRLILDYHVT